MLALSQSPITANQIKEWNDKLNNDEIYEIIDIDTNYMEDDDVDTDSKKKILIKKMIENVSTEDDEFNPTLAAMERNKIKTYIN